MSQTFTRSITATASGLALCLLGGLSNSVAASPSSSTYTPGPFGPSTKVLKTLDLPATTNKARLSPSTEVDTTKSQTSFGKFNCNDLRRAALKMAVHASNIANRETTRTPEGGAYQRQDLVCHVAGSFCSIEKSTQSRTVFLPGHPDADSNGMVKYPSINVATETAGLQNAANELRMLASLGTCGAKAMELGSTITIKYGFDFDVSTDTLGFNRDGRLTSWSRITKDGRSQDFAFNQDGTIQGL